MLKALITFTIIFLIVTIGLVIIWNFSEQNTVKLNYSKLNLSSDLFTRVYSIKEIDSLTASYNLPFTIKNRDLKLSDIRL